MKGKLRYVMEVGKGGQLEGFRFHEFYFHQRGSRIIRRENRRSRRNSLLMKFPEFVWFSIVPFSSRIILVENNLFPFVEDFLEDILYTKISSVSSEIVGITGVVQLYGCWVLKCVVIHV